MAIAGAMFWPQRAVRGWMVLVGAFLACESGPARDRGPADGAATDTPASLPPVDSGAAKLLPADEADASFAAFREELLRALGQRDTAFLYAIVSPSIRNSFGPDDGIAGFREKWRPGDAGSLVWQALTAVLHMGGRLEDSTFIAPYVFAFWPDSIDAFQFAAVTREHAPVHAEPRADANRVGSASWSILQVEEWTGMGDAFVAADSSWVRVRLPAGGVGWMHASDAYSPIGWRAIFERQNGRWRLITFLAGD